MFIPVILGTAREGRFSEFAANYILSEVKKSGIESQIVDAKDYRIPYSDKSGKFPESEKLKAIVNKSNALIIVMPEYNHGIPGELKMMLDMLYSEYYGKPAAMCGVSMGPVGGARGLQALKLVLLSLSMVPINEVVYFPGIRELFNADGSIKDKSYDAKVSGMLEALKKRIK